MIVGILNKHFLSFFPLLLYWVLMVVPLSDAKAETVQVTFFGNNQYQPLNIEWVNPQEAFKITVFNLDAHKNLEEELSAGLPKGDLDQATVIARQRVSAIPQTRWDSLFEGLMLARKWNIQRYPAVVFGDGESVIYGVCDLQKAVEYWTLSRDGRL